MTPNLPSDYPRDVRLIHVILACERRNGSARLVGLQYRQNVGICEFAVRAFRALKGARSNRSKSSNCLYPLIGHAPENTSDGWSRKVEHQAHISDRTIVMLNVISDQLFRLAVRQQSTGRQFGMVMEMLFVARGVTPLCNAISDIVGPSAQKEIAAKTTRWIIASVTDGHPSGIFAVLEKIGYTVCEESLTGNREESVTGRVARAGPLPTSSLWALALFFIDVAPKALNELRREFGELTIRFSHFISNQVNVVKAAIGAETSMAACLL